MAYEQAQTYLGGTDYQNTDEEVKLQRSKDSDRRWLRNQNQIRYNYVPGELHRQTFFKENPVVVNTSGLKLAPDYENATARIIGKGKRAQAVIDTPTKIVGNASADYYRGFNIGENNYDTKGYDSYLFPDRRVVRTPIQRETPRMNLEIPTFPNDNTSVATGAGGFNPIMGGRVPVQEKIEAPENYQGRKAVRKTIQDGSGSVKEIWVDAETGEYLGRFEPQPNPSGSYVIKKTGGKLSYLKFFN